MEEIWQLDQFINPNIPYIFNREIIEYDLKEAGFSISREFKLLDDERINTLYKLDKSARHRRIGIYQRDDKEFKENLKLGFSKARELFIIQNDIKKNDIISIKKDALFICKKCEYQKIGEYLNFRPKNVYSSYIRLNNNLELYYSKGEIDVKGLGDKVELHQNHMMKFFKTYFYKMETESSTIVIDFVRRYIDRYKKKELEVGFYRTFDKRSTIELLDDETSYVVSESIKDNVDIRYNLFNVFIKLIKIPL